MSKRKSFKSDALGTLTGGVSPKAKESKKVAPVEVEGKNGVEVKKPKKVAQSAKKPSSEAKIAQTITSRSSERTGKPVTLYLNTENYAAFKVKAKEDKRTASNLINEFIAEYISK